MANVATTYQFNGAAWNTLSSLSAATSDGIGGSNCYYQAAAFSIMGSIATDTVNRWIPSSWSSFTATGTAVVRQGISAGALNNILYETTGDNGGTARSTGEKLSTSSWASFTNPYSGINRYGAGSLTSVNTILWLGGKTAVGDETRIMNTAEVVSGGTASAIDRFYFAAALYNKKVYKMNGATTNDGTSGVANVSSTTDGASAWTVESVSLTATTRQSASSSLGYLRIHGGLPTSGASTAATQKFNGSWAADVAQPVALNLFNGTASI